MCWPSKYSLSACYEPGSVIGIGTTELGIGQGICWKAEVMKVVKDGPVKEMLYKLDLGQIQLGRMLCTSM